MKKGRILQIVAAVFANLSSFGIGAAFSWSSPVLARLGIAGYSPFTSKVGSYETMLLAALVCLGIGIGPFPLAYVAEKIGRKKTILFMTIPTVISWALIIFAKSIVQVLVGRFFIGFSGSAVFSIVPRYVAEIAEDDNRGGLGSFLQLFVCLGMLYAYCIGPYVSYMMFSSACLCIQLVLILTFVWMPESPYYYASKNKDEDTVKCLMRFRGKTKEEAQEEAAHIKAMVEQSTVGTYKELFTTKEHWWPLCIMEGLAITIPFSGATAVQIYAEPILMKTNTDLSSAILAIIMGVVQAILACFTPLMFNRLGRRTLLLIFSATATVALIIFGAYFVFLQNIDHVAVQFVPITVMIIFIASNIFGFGGITWVIMSEIFPGHLVSKSMAVGAATCNLGAFIVSLMFSQLSTWLGPGGLFWMFSAFSLLAFLFVLFVVPETRGQSFAQISEKMKKGRKTARDEARAT